VCIQIQKYLLFTGFTDVLIIL